VGPYYCWVTPDTQERNPFGAIAVLVVLMALVAGLAMRFGVNSLVAVVCVAIAIVGTWIILSPENEVLQPVLGASTGATSAPASTPASGVSAFSSAGNETATREQLRGKPRMAVGFQGQEGDAAPTVAPRLPSGHDDLFAESVAPVRALGQLPPDARVLAVETTVDPATNVGGSFTMGRFEVRAASRSGSDHVILSESRQDDYVVAQAADGRYLVVVVADGQGAAENAHYGAYWATRLLAQTIDRHLRDGVPGIEKMLERTRDDVTQLFDMRFTDGTKMRTIATTLVGLIAPIDGGPAAGFRVGDGDILVDGDDGWSSLFEPLSSERAEQVFPRSIDADARRSTWRPHCRGRLVRTPLTRAAALVPQVCGATGELLLASWLV